MCCNQCKEFKPVLTDGLCNICLANISPKKIDKPTLTGKKYDDGKPRLDLLSTTWLRGVGSVMGFGAKKYAANNWRGGIEYSRLIAAALRHITAFNDGEDLDPETGLSHIYHASCCLMFLGEFVEKRKDLDDRYKPKE